MLGRYCEDLSAALGIVCDRRFSAMPLNMGNPDPNPMVEGRSSREGDSTSPRHSHRKDDLRPERSHPLANSPIGRASGGGASRGRSRHAPALGWEWRQAPWGSPWLEPERPVPT